MQRPIYTVRVTALESFRMFLWGQNEQNESYINEENTIATIMGTERSNIKADYGSAGHKIIESPNQNRTNTGYQIGDFTFTDSQVSPLLKFRQEHPLMMREVPLAKLYHTTTFDLIVTGTCDHLEGNDIRDTKFKFSSFDIADFMNSCQHKFYLDMMGMKNFYYDFFRVTGFEKIGDCPTSKIGECESLYLNTCEGMERDLQDTLNEFSDWITFKNLQQYIEITPKKVKRILAGNSKLKKIIV